MARRDQGGLFGTVRRALLPRGPLEPAAALTAIGTTLYTWDIGTDQLAWGPNAAEILGVPHIGLFSDGEAFATAVEPAQGMSRAEAVIGSDERDDGDGVPYRARYPLRTKAGRLVVIEDTGRWFADADGRPAIAHGTIRIDTTAEENSLAGTLKARAALLAQIVDDVVEAQRSRHSLTLVVGALENVEPDHDDIVADLARRLRPLMRRGDRFIPYAPNRFALALASCAASEAHNAVERLLALLDGEPFAAHLRLGVANAPEHALDAPTLLRRAEEALAQASDRYAIYAPPAAAASTGPAGTSSDALIDALNGRDLVAAHRPVRDARTGEPVLATLVPRLGRAGPASCAGDVTAAAERAGFSLLVDARLLEIAADHLALRLLQRLALPIAPSTLREGEWLNTLAAHLGARPGVESRLMIEVPESTLRDKVAVGRLRAMKALGVGIMISGFGAGHVGLAHLRQLPIDLVKIDGALIGNLGRSTEDRLLVHRLVDLAHHLGLGTIASCVPDEASAQILADWGIDYLEGPCCGRAAIPEQETERRQALAG
jgi:EAL domain-containing protein (putative c-di-GMP-specific phosphodiesterase class I)/GGDEF domain-containing protein